MSGADKQVSEKEEEKDGILGCDPGLETQNSQGEKQEHVRPLPVLGFAGGSPLTSYICS